MVVKWFRKRGVVSPERRRCADLQAMSAAARRDALAGIDVLTGQPCECALGGMALSTGCRARQDAVRQREQVADRGRHMGRRVMQHLQDQDKAGKPVSSARAVNGTVRLGPKLVRGGTPADGIERLCQERGLKMTGQRRTIARVLSESDDHPDVEELYRRASQLDARISIATVYRTVRLFEERGILQRRDFGSGRARYEPADHGPHHHLIDVETGSVIEFRSSEHERLVRAVAEQLGFDVISLRLDVFGRRSAEPGARAPLMKRRTTGAP